MTNFSLVLLSIAYIVESTTTIAAENIRVLIVDGQNNHEWKITTPLMTRFYEESGRFTVEVATSPPYRHDMNRFKPCFANYDVVVCNYNGDRWSQEMESSFQSYVHSGGGIVTVHAANNSFPDWPEYNEMIGLGGWRGRNEKSGPYIYFSDSTQVRDYSPGRGGNHGSQHEFQVETRSPNHPIMRGIPKVWLHTKDELYGQLRGPAKNIEILATAYADPKQQGTGRGEPILMTVRYGRGRVFHTVLGHTYYSMNCVGFVTTLLRGTEWAATGEVTIPVLNNFPTANKSQTLD